MKITGFGYNADTGKVVVTSDMGVMEWCPVAGAGVQSARRVVAELMRLLAAGQGLAEDQFSVDDASRLVYFSEEKAS